MKILIAAPMPPQAQGAGAIPKVLFAQLSGLLGQHHQISFVTVAGTDPGEWAAVEELQKAGVDMHAIRRVDPTGLARWQRRWRFATAWLSGKYPWRTVWFWEPAVQTTLDHLLAGNSFDLVLVEDNAMGIYQFNTATPLIFTEYEVRRPRRMNWRGLLKKPGVKALLGELDWQRWPAYERRVWSRFKVVQVFSPYDAAGVKKVAPELAERVRVNPFSIEIPALADPKVEEAGNVLFTGNFTHPPNVDAAVWLADEIMPLLRKSYPGVRLTLAGSFPPEQVQRLACDDITVTGYVEKIEPYIERAAVIVAPIRTGGGQRMKVLEGMACGKAVVTTPRGAEGLQLEGQPEPPLRIAASATEFAAATLALLQDRELRRALGQQARGFVSDHYSPAAYTRRLENVCNEFLALK